MSDQGEGSCIDSCTEKSQLDDINRPKSISSGLTPEFNRLELNYSCNESRRSDGEVVHNKELRVFIKALMKTMREDSIPWTRIKELFSNAFVKMTAEGYNNAVIAGVWNNLLKDVSGSKFCFNFATEY